MRGKSRSDHEKSRENLSIVQSVSREGIFALAAIINFPFHDEMLRFSRAHTKPLRHNLAPLIVERIRVFFSLSLV